MEFETILRSIVDECGGGLGAALMGLDGIAVAQVSATGGRDREDPLQGDVSGAGIEFGRLLPELAKAAEAVGAGDLHETFVRLDRVDLVFQLVEEDLFLILALHPDGNLGKARYLVRRSLNALRAEL